MNIHKAFYFLLISFLYGYSYALPPQNDPKAELVLQAYRTSLQSISDFSAEFVWETGNMRLKASKTGYVKYKKGMYMIDFPRDREQIFCDKAQQWIFDQDRGQVLQRDYDPYYGASLELIFESYKGNEDARYDGEEMVKGAICHKVSVNVQDQSSAYSRIVLWINQQTNLLEKAVLLDHSQTTTTYTFKNIRLNRGFSDKDFRFDENRYPDVEVIKE